ncbi:replicative DNA helicase [Rhodopirellula sp. MGV]|uniref:replicative DNA helicase n=1 Tax=Rhodopirellula sp. MGV TaxID=2023130 RepID=UPI000B96E7EF|nr:DnaB-like helicase C-terminal domain-containing protein [Rhodopirellula sp. MGV]OYP38903.1 hypothetical protein CGZ80_01400 [Rhodopirellula sp. MGV]PNY38283.1 hypothetical protein C2E31_02935 [Rhodopirellula baltica]
MSEIETSVAEIGLINSMLLAPATITQTCLTVTESDIVCEVRRELFSMLVDMNEAGEAIRDEVLVMSRIRDSGLLDRLGGVKGFRQYQNAEAAPNAKLYAAAVRRNAVRRQICQLASQFQARAYDGDPGELADWLRSELGAIESRATETVHISQLSQCCADLIGAIEQTQRDGGSPCVPTGIEWFDAVYRGLQPGRVYVMAARPGVGKSAMLQQIAEFIASHSHGAHFVSLEMPRAEIASRYLARQTGINSKFLSGHTVDLEQHGGRLVEAECASQSMPMTISEPIGRRATLNAICAEARVMKATHNIKLLACDYLQIIEPANSKQSEYERVSEATRAFKQLSRELGIPILLLSQLNRETEKGKEMRRPRNSDLRGSGSIEQDADCVILLHQESKTRVHFHVSKMRGAERGETFLKFDGATCTFSPEPIEDDPKYHPEFGDGAW